LIRSVTNYIWICFRKQFFLTMNIRVGLGRAGPGWAGNFRPVQSSSPNLTTASAQYLRLSERFFHLQFLSCVSTQHAGWMRDIDIALLSLYAHVRLPILSLPFDCYSYCDSPSNSNQIAVERQSKLQPSPYY